MPSVKPTPLLNADHSAVLEAASYCHYYGACFHILAAPRLRENPRVWRHVYLDPASDRHRSIDFDSMLRDRSFGHVQHLMLTAASSVFNGNNEVNLYELALLLPHRDLRRVMQAIAMLVGLR